MAARSRSASSTSCAADMARVLGLELRITRRSGCSLRAGRMYELERAQQYLEEQIAFVSSGTCRSTTPSRCLPASISTVGVGTGRPVGARRGRVREPDQRDHRPDRARTPARAARRPGRLGRPRRGLALSQPGVTCSGSGMRTRARGGCVARRRSRADGRGGSCRLILRPRSGTFGLRASSRTGSGRRVRSTRRGGVAEPFSAPDRGDAAPQQRRGGRAAVRTSRRGRSRRRRTTRLCWSACGARPPPAAGPASKLLRQALRVAWRCGSTWATTLVPGEPGGLDVRELDVLRRSPPGSGTRRRRRPRALERTARHHSPRSCQACR